MTSPVTCCVRPESMDALASRNRKHHLPASRLPATRRRRTDRKHPAARARIGRLVGCAAHRSRADSQSGRRSAAARYVGRELAPDRREATDVGGVPVPAGAKLLLLLASANHDPGRFPDPRTFRSLPRQRSRSHSILGWASTTVWAPRSRGVQVAIVLELLSARFPPPALAARLNAIRSRPNISFPRPDGIVARAGRRNEATVHRVCTRGGRHRRRHRRCCVVSPVVLHGSPDAGAVSTRWSPSD